MLSKTGRRGSSSVVLLLAAAAAAQAPALVKDIQTAGINPDSSPQWFERAGPWTLFAAQHFDTGRELYRTLGVGTTTSLLLDIHPGSASSHPVPIATVSNQLLFAADDGSAGRELWITNGNASGTQRFADLNPGPTGSNPALVGRDGATIYLAVDDGVHGQELWRTDGTVAGTSLVRDIHAGSGASYPRAGVAHGGAFYFVAQDATSGLELWRTDGTAAGTTLVKDIRPGPSSSFSLAIELVSFQGRVWFAANDGTTGAELWASDGTAQGTVLVKDIQTGAASGSPRELTVFGSLLVFAADTGGSRFGDIEPWRSDGTPQGTVRIADLSQQSSAPHDFTLFQGAVWFGAAAQLWRSDGTAPGTTSIANVEATQLRVFGNVLCFAGRPPGLSLDFEPWISDGTPAGTKLLVDIVPGSGGSAPAAMTMHAGLLYFSADDATHGREPWVTDATPAGTKLLRDVDDGAGRSLGSDPTTLRDALGRTFFVADDGQRGRELWISDGTNTGTQLVADIVAGSGSSTPQQITAYGRHVFFTCDDGVHGRELWISDGTAAGTRLVLDIFPGTQSSTPTELKVFGDRVFFSAQGGDGDVELWSSAGTAATTMQVANLQHPGSGAPKHLTVAGARLFFRSWVTGFGEELCVSDGTRAGTGLVKDIAPGSTGSMPGELAAFGERVVFAAYDPTNGYEPWISDGTAAGTRLLRDVRGGANGSSPRDFVASQGRVLFAADDGVAGTELWVTDGTANGTMLLADFVPGSASSDPRELTATPFGVVLSARQPGGFALITSNGTAAGTQAFFPMTAVFALATDVLTRVGARQVYFVMHEVAHGSQLWRTDGTAAGTVRVTQTFQAAQYEPWSPVVSGGDLRFVSSDGRKGREVWQSHPGAVAQPMASGCTPAGPVPVLDASDPLLGQRFELRGEHAPPNTVGLLLLGAPPSGTAFLPGGCLVQVDLGSLALLLPFVPQAASYRIGWTTPNDTMLNDVTLSAQVWHLAASFPAQTSATNGVFLRIGNR